MAAARRPPPDGPSFVASALLTAGILLGLFDRQGQWPAVFGRLAGYERAGPPAAIDLAAAFVARTLASRPGRVLLLVDRPPGREGPVTHLVYRTRRDAFPRPIDVAHRGPSGPVLLDLDYRRYRPSRVDVDAYDVLVTAGDDLAGRPEVAARFRPVAVTAAPGLGTITVLVGEGRRGR